MIYCSNIPRLYYINTYNSISYIQVFVEIWSWSSPDVEKVYMYHDDEDLRYGTITIARINHSKIKIETYFMFWFYFMVGQKGVSHHILNANEINEMSMFNQNFNNKSYRRMLTSQIHSGYNGN